MSRGRVSEAISARGSNPPFLGDLATNILTFLKFNRYQWIKKKVLFEVGRFAEEFDGLLLGDVLEGLVVDLDYLVAHFQLPVVPGCRI